MPFPTKSARKKPLKDNVQSVEKETPQVVTDTRPATEAAVSVSTKCVRTTSSVSENFRLLLNVLSAELMSNVEISRFAMTTETVFAGTNSVEKEQSALLRMPMENVWLVGRTTPMNVMNSRPVLTTNVVASMSHAPSTLTVTRRLLMEPVLNGTDV